MYLEINNQNISNFPFQRALLTEIQYSNGNKGQMVTLMSLDVKTEEACIGIRKGLLYDEKAISCIIKVCSIKDSVLKVFTEFDEYIFSEEERELLFKKD